MCSILEEIVPHYDRFPESVNTVRADVGAGVRQGAVEEYASTMRPEADAVFEHFSEILQIVDQIDGRRVEVIALAGMAIGVVLAHLQSAAHHPRVIVLTTFAGPSEREKALALGAESFLDKSTEYEELFDLLEAE